MSVALGRIALVLATGFLGLGEGKLSASGAGVAVELGAGLEVEVLEKDLWLYRATAIREPFGAVTSNGLIVAGSEGVWLIDTPWNDEQTTALLDWIEQEVGAPRGLVATHYHQDRLGGIAEAHRRGLETWGHAETARLAPSGGLEPPSHTFDSHVELSTGSESFEVFYPGGGHTLDNTVVWFPERQLLVGGCLIKSAGSKSAGFVGDAVLDAWPESLAVLGRRYPDARLVIPGHGASGTLDLLAHTAELVARASQAGSVAVDLPD